MAGSFGVETPPVARISDDRQRLGSTIAFQQLIIYCIVAVSNAVSIYLNKCLSKSAINQVINYNKATIKSVISQPRRMVFLTSDDKDLTDN